MKKLFAVALAVSASLAATTPCYAGWQQTQNNKWYYTDDQTGAVLKGSWVQDTDHNWLLLGTDGYMVSNRWIFDGGSDWYFAGADGSLLKGTYKLPEHYEYYSTPDGRYVASTVGAGSYSFDAEGLNY